MTRADDRGAGRRSRIGQDATSPPGPTSTTSDPVGSTALMLAIRNDDAGRRCSCSKRAPTRTSPRQATRRCTWPSRGRITSSSRRCSRTARSPNIRLTKGEPDPEGNRRFNQLPEYLLGATPFLLATALNEIDAMKVLVKAVRIPRSRWPTARRPSWRRWAFSRACSPSFPSRRFPPRGAAGDNTAYFQRKKLFSRRKVLRDHEARRLSSAATSTRPAAR